MNKYYRRERGLYDSSSSESFRISRSAIDLYLRCPRCFYLDKKLGLSRPSLPGWPINSAVDQLLKNEFDSLRKSGSSHWLMEKYGIEAIPFNHPDLPLWRDDVYQRLGASVLDKETNLKICGIIDDLWLNTKTQEIHIVDYKATSTSREISLDDEYKEGYKKQAEVYQWIFRKMGFNVSALVYFLFANAQKNRPSFEGKLDFELSIIPYRGDDSWLEPTIFEIKKTLESNKIPPSKEDCEFCAYRNLIKEVEG